MKKWENSLGRVRARIGQKHAPQKAPHFTSGALGFPINRQAQQRKEIQP